MAPHRVPDGDPISLTTPGGGTFTVTDPSALKEVFQDFS
jgi:hypothetical protein